MELNSTEKKLLQILQNGMPLVTDPFGLIAEQINCNKNDVLEYCKRFKENNYIKRIGVIVNHPKLGYVHNGMIVWNIPDDKTDIIAEKFCAYSFVTLCYQRPRQLPQWPFNLFCMIHGKSRAQVISQVKTIINDCELQNIEHNILFSTRQFKQQGGSYA